MTRLGKLICIVLMMLLLPMQPVFGASSQAAAADIADIAEVCEETAHTDQLLVLLEEGTRSGEIREIAEGSGAELETVNSLEDGTRLAALQVDPDSMQEVAEDISGSEKVIIVQPNYKYRLEETAPADEHISYQKYLSDPQSIDGDSGRQLAGAIDAFGAWSDLSPYDAANKVRVAVIDTGAYIDHPDLAANINRDLCVTFNDGQKGSFTEWDGYQDDHGHGTHVCGIIAAATNNGRGVAGVAYNRAELFCIDATGKDDNTVFTTQDICMSIDYAVGQGAKLINLSLGGLYRDLLMERSARNAWDNGALCICAAGNESSDASQSPGDSPCSISVKAHDEYAEAVGTSNYGEDKDVSAPGRSIMSTCIKTTRSGSGKVVPAEPLTPTYENKTGTSMAAPVVTGIAAMLLSEDGSLTPRQIKNYIYTSSGQDSFLGLRKEPGFGMVNAKSALANLRNSTGDAVISDIVINRTQAELYAGESVSLDYEVLPAEAGRRAGDVAYSSSDESVAVVDAYGMITGVSPGKAVITLSAGDLSRDCSVTVIPPEITKFSKRPFKITEYLEEDDAVISVNEDKWNEWASFADIYQTKLKAKERLSIGLKMYDSRAIPYIRIVRAGGAVVSGRAGGGRSVSLSYTASSAGTYRIEVLNKPYNNTGNSSIRYNLTVDSSMIDLPRATIKKAAGASKAFTVKWKKLSKARRKKVSRLQIQYSTSPDFASGSTRSVYAGNTASSKKVGGLRSKRYYYVRIRSYRKAGGVKHYSKWSVVKRVRTK